jgi:hypothetical protein
MVRLLSLAFICSGLSLGAIAQLKNQFTVENQATYEKVDLKMTAKTGSCFIRSGQKPDILNIYSNLEPEDYRHTFSTEVKGSLCEIKLVLEQEEQTGVGKKLSEQVWGGNEKSAEKFWRVFLSNNKPFSLNFENGLGNTNIDLAGLSVSKLKVNTGSANVNIFYGVPVQNKIDMDTFFVKVDIGSLIARNVTMSRSKTIVADIGFGNAFLDLSEVADVSRNVIGSIGAGDLVILLPYADVPVFVKINESFLCNVNLGKNLKKIGENTFASASYRPDAKNILSFDLDVSWGKIVFKEKNP